MVGGEEGVPKEEEGGMVEGGLVVDFHKCLG